VPELAPLGLKSLPLLVLGPMVAVPARKA